MNMKIFLLSLFLILLIQDSYQGVVAGAGCFAACVTPCLMMGPGKFAAFVGIAFDIAGCVPLCYVTCANALPIPGICFDEATTIHRVLKDNTTEQVSITTLKQGDTVLTTNWLNHQLEHTQVTSISHFNEMSDFIKLTYLYEDEQLEDQGNIEVTKEHFMIIRDKEGKIHARQAQSIQVGNEILTSKGTAKITKLSKSTKEFRVQLSTQHGTILANDVLTTSHCDHHLLSD